MQQMATAKILMLHGRLSRIQWRGLARHRVSVRPIGTTNAEFLSTSKCVLAIHMRVNIASPKYFPLGGSA